eukprot:11939345-Alexandrium_andersonii.AAC.1
MSVTLSGSERAFRNSNRRISGARVSDHAFRDLHLEGSKPEYAWCALSGGLLWKTPPAFQSDSLSCGCILIAFRIVVRMRCGCSFGVWALQFCASGCLTRKAFAFRVWHFGHAQSVLFCSEPLSACVLVRLRACLLACWAA